MKTYHTLQILFISLFLNFKTICQDERTKTIDKIESLIIEYKVPADENNIIFKKYGIELSKDDACKNTKKKITSRFTIYENKLTEINTDKPNSLIDEYNKVNKTSLGIFKIIDDNLKESTCSSHTTPDYYKLSKTEGETLYIISDIVRFNTNLRLLQTICYQLILNDKVKEIEDNLKKYHTVEAYKADSINIYKKINSLGSIINTKLSTEDFNNTIKKYLKTEQFDSLFNLKHKIDIVDTSKPVVFDTTGIYKFINKKDSTLKSEIKNINGRVDTLKINIDQELNSKPFKDTVSTISTKRVEYYRKNEFSNDFKEEAKKKWWIPALLITNTITIILLFFIKN